MFQVLISLRCMTGFVPSTRVEYCRAEASGERVIYGISKDVNFLEGNQGLSIPFEGFRVRFPRFDLIESQTR